MDPFLEQQHRATSSRSPCRDEDRLRGDRQWLVLRTVDEAGEVQIPVIGPTHGLIDQRDGLAQRGDHADGGVEYHVVRAARDPEGQVVLGLAWRSHRLRPPARQSQ
jgi:hypothetical protein